MQSVGMARKRQAARVAWLRGLVRVPRVKLPRWRTKGTEGGE